MAKKTTSPKKVMASKKLPDKIIKYLEKAGVPHDVIEHKTVYTAYDAAATMGKKLNEIAKSLLVKADKDYFLVLLPADHNVDFDKLKKHIGKIKKKDVKVVKIPGEKIMQEALKIKAGALTAFGGVHKLPTIIDEQLAKAKKAIFSSGSLNHSIEMGVKDFVKMENVVFGKFAKKRIKTNKKTVKTKKKIIKKKNGK